MEERNPVPEVPAVPVLGVLYESSEWSDFKFAMELCARDVPVRMIDMERPDAVEVALARTMLTSRVPASAVARGARTVACAYARIDRGGRGRGDPHGEHGKRVSL